MTERGTPPGGRCRGAQLAGDDLCGFLSVRYLGISPFGPDKRGRFMDLSVNRPATSALRDTRSKAGDGDGLAFKLCSGRRLGG